MIVDIALPQGSRLHVSVASAQVRADGRYADCKLESASGDFSVESVAGNIKADTASGVVTVDVVKGAAAIASASGNATIGDLDGEVKFRAASGSLTVRRLQGNVNAQTASGDITVATAVNGSVSVQTSSGAVVVGIAEGTAAQLDLRTGSGEVRNTLAPSDGPADGDETLIVHARTGSGTSPCSARPPKRCPNRQVLSGLRYPCLDPGRTGTRRVGLPARRTHPGRRRARGPSVWRTRRRPAP